VSGETRNDQLHTVEAVALWLYLSRSRDCVFKSYRTTETTIGGSHVSTALGIGGSAKRHRLCLALFHILKQRAIFCMVGTLFDTVELQFS
jgi:hypothetical protein